jgi:hypothetical protein
MLIAFDDTTWTAEIVQRSDKKKEKVYRQYLRLEAHMKMYMFERNEKMDAGREKNVIWGASERENQRFAGYSWLRQQ